MATTDPSFILLGTLDAAAMTDLRRLLEEAGHRIVVQSFEELAPAQLAGLQLIVLDGSRSVSEALRCCRRLRAVPGDGAMPVFVILYDPAPATRLACLEAGANLYIIHPFLPEELLAQVQTFLRIHQLHARLADQADELQRANQRLQRTYQQTDVELEAARRLQLSFLPPTLPEVGPVRFAVQYRPCGRVGGDFYDVFRLDETHVGFYVADVMGHGVPASLLTIFLKRGVRAKEINGRHYHLVSPAVVLTRLNQDLMEQKLADLPFISMVYGLLDSRTGTVQLARAGHPYPLYVPSAGDLQMWPGSGGLLGVFVSDFPVRTQQLRPGDKLLLYTDGLDTGSTDGTGDTAQRLQVSAERHRRLPIAEFVPRLTQELLGQVRQADDFTLLGLEMTT